MKQTTNIEAYPLQWPMAYQRTEPGKRTASKFKQGMEVTQKLLRAEVQRLGGKQLIVSTNVPVRQNGGLYTDYMRYKIDDPGAAIYFMYEGKQVSMCCDKYTAVWENLYALAKGIEAIRGMNRWGISNFLERAFTGFTALPPPPDIWAILGLDAKPAFSKQVIEAYRTKAKQLHPDNGGTQSAMQELNDAYAQALKFYL